VVGLGFLKVWVTIWLFGCFCYILVVIPANRRMVRDGYVTHRTVVT